MCLLVFVLKGIYINNIILNFIVRTITICFISAIVFIIRYFRTQEFKYLKVKIKNKLLKNLK